MILRRRGREVTSIGIALTARRLRIPASLSHYGVYVLLAVLTGAAFMTSPAFRTSETFLSIMKQSAALSIVAFGQTYLIIMGGMDLSVSSLISLVVTVSCGVMLGLDARIGLALVSVGAIGLTVGFLNGLLISRLRVHPVVLTFGMYSILQGAVFLYTDRSILFSALWGSHPRNPATILRVLPALSAETWTSVT